MSKTILAAVVRLFAIGLAIVGVVWIAVDSWRVGFRAALRPFLMDAYLIFLWLFVGYAMWSLFPEWWPATTYFWRHGIGDASVAVLAALAVWPATNAFERQHNHRFLWHR
jgi:hypothetical protein